MRFLGEKFCPHCGAAAARSEVAEGESRLCPRCRTPLSAVVLGSSTLHECSRCEGIWLDAAALEHIAADRERQAAVLGSATQLPASESEALEVNVRYLPCPVCTQLMNRVNFANSSHVIVDVCKPHGTWFDRDELRRTVEFIRAGGLKDAYAREVEELQARKRALSAAQISSPDLIGFPGEDSRASGWSAGLSLAEGLLDLFLKR